MLRIQCPGGMDVLGKIEQVPSDKATDRPLREIKIINIEMSVSVPPFHYLPTPLLVIPSLTPRASFASHNNSFQDPYAVYLARLANKLASNARNASSSVQKEKTRLERESDRTSWFGEDLDKAGKKRKADAATEADLLEEAAGAGAGVGKYLEEQKRKAREEKAASAVGGGAKAGAGGFGFGVAGAGAGGAGAAAAKKRKGAGGGFGDFSAW